MLTKDFIKRNLVTYGRVDYYAVPIAGILS